MLRSALYAALLTLITQFPLAQAADLPPILTHRFTALNGEPAALERYQGRVLLVNFWATWCPPCVREMPALSRLQQALKEEPFEILAISVGETSDEVNGFLQRLDTPLALELLLDPEGRSFRDFNLIGLPISYLYDRAGREVRVITGEQHWDSNEWQEQIRALLAP